MHRLHPTHSAPLAKRSLSASRTVAVLSATLALTLAACGSDDGGASVTDLGADDSGSTSASGSSSASASASASAIAGDTNDVEDADADGGYSYASDVNSHRRVVLDICEVNTLLEADPIDFDAIETLYRDGANSPSGDGFRSVGGFAVSEDRSHGVDAYYGTPTPLDDFVTAAIEGTGVFESADAAARRQGIQKGVQNQIMVAWVVHELNAALAKADAGEFDAADGAPHNWDEAWAFYHGAEPSCAPYVTGDKRAANFGTLEADGETATANAAILAAMNEGLAALLAEDAAGAHSAADEVIRQLVVIYSQAAIRYAEVAQEDVAAGEDPSTHLMEGYAFFRVVEPLIGDLIDTDAIAGIYDIETNQPGGGSAEVTAILQPAFDEFGIGADDIGTLG